MHSLTTNLHKRTTMKATELRAQVTDRLITLMETTKDRPWRQPWNFGPNVGVPTSAATRLPYRGSNAIWLDLTSMLNGYKSKNWNTYMNWSKLGIYPKQGSKATWGFFYGKFGKETEDENGDKSIKWMPAMKTFALFNAEQCHGDRIKEFLIDPEGTVAYEANYGQFDELIARHKIIVKNDKMSAGYLPSSEVIGMPKRGYFKDAASYYAALAHEICHWTERKALDDHSRKTREDYAFYELVAEIGSGYLLRELGLPAVETERVIENSAIYLAGWLKSMRNDTSYIFKAASRAGKIVDYLIGQKEEEIKEEAGELVTA
jgi:antirestriction protein ArdC